MSGIYTLEGNRLTYCWAHPNQSRPKEFKSEPGSRHTLVRLERFSTGEEKVAKQLTAAGITYKLDDEVGWIQSVHLTPTHNPADFFPLISTLKEIETIHAFNVTDDSLAPLAGLKRLAMLDLQGDQLTDRGLSIIPSLPKLSILHLNSGSLTDDGLVHLTKMPAGSALQLKGTKITVNGLKGLKHLSLRSLTLNDCTLVTADLETIVSLFPSLGQISLEDCQIVDAEFRPLTKLKNLVSLNLSGTSFNDQSMKQIVQLKKISNLYLDRTTITDESLSEAARSFTNLQYFSAKGTTTISDNGLRELSSAKNLVYFWASIGTFTPEAIKQFNNNAMKSRVYER